MEADRLAGEHLFLVKPAESEYEGCRTELYGGEMKVTIGLKPFIEGKWSRKGTHGYARYIMEKYGWIRHVLESIEWEAATTRRMKLSQQIFFASAAHGWLPLNMKLGERESVPDSRYPVCGMKGENIEHFVFCKAYKAQWRSMMNEMIDMASVKGKVSAHIKEILKVGMSKKVFCKRNWIGKVIKQYEELVRGQDEIGWDHLWYGRWSSGWKNSEQGAAVSPARSREILPWMRNIIKSMWKFMQDKWKERGKAAETDAHQVRREHLMAEVRNLMGDERNFLVRYGFMFKPGVQALERSTLSHIQYWVVKSGSIIRKWRAQEKEKYKRNKGKGDIWSYFEQDKKKTGLGLGRR